MRNSEQGNALRKKFSTLTSPQEPYKRKLTDAEIDTMYIHFLDHSWFKFIDAEGRIIMGGGEEDERGMYYITEDDLNSLAPKNIA